MITRYAACSCGQLGLEARGEPIRDAVPEAVAVPVGAFADPGFPAPRVSVYEGRRHAWVSVPDNVEHYG